MNSIFILFLVIGFSNGKPGQSKCVGAHCEAEAKKYLENFYEKAANEKYNKFVHADWNYNTDLLNSEAEEAVNAANTELANFIFQEWKENISIYDFESFSEGTVKRQLKFLNDIGTAALPEDSLLQYNKVLSEMSKIYGTAKVCPFTNQNCNISTEGLPLEPALEGIVASSKDYEELEYVWKKWRDNSGKLMRNLYNVYIDIGNEAAILNNYPDMGAFWVRQYESEDFRNDMGLLWNELKDVYDEVHAYVRYRLQSKFPGKIKDGEPIPASVLGNMWAQTWDNIYKDVVPYPNAPVFDVTESLKERFNETQEGIFAMFEVANEFFLSLGLEDMGMSYGPLSMIIKPNDREVVCHASAWDFYDKTDFRVKMCTGVNQEDFITVHHELGHIQYFLQYKNQPVIFREGANPGFHEALGDVMSLSVATTKHMIELGYLQPIPPSRESTINFLMQKALEKIAFLPFGYLIDAYRWKIYDGSIPRDKLEYNWIKYRSDYQGVVPPVIRSEADFDAGAKYHVPGNTPYIRYFVSFILQFQLYEKLCIDAGEFEPNNPEKPLYDCDFYNNLKAGDTLKKILEKGFSQNWEELLLETIGESKLSARPLRAYFEPLTQFLIEEREAKGYSKGWRSDAFEEFYQQ